MSDFKLVPFLVFSLLVLACTMNGNRETPSTDVESSAGPPENGSGPTAFLELFPVFLSGEKAFVLVPYSAQSWQFPMNKSGHAHDQVRNRLATHSLDPEVIHSTSWRQDGEQLIITYLVVIRSPRNPPEGFRAITAARSELARGGAASPPEDIPARAVIHHALQHLAWLYQTDPAVRDTLAEDWKGPLALFQAQPARSLDN